MYPIQEITERICSRVEEELNRDGYQPVLDRMIDGENFELGEIIKSIAGRAMDPESVRFQGVLIYRSMQEKFDESGMTFPRVTPETIKEYQTELLKPHSSHFTYLSRRLENHQRFMYFKIYHHPNDPDTTLLVNVGLVVYYCLERQYCEDLKNQKEEAVRDGDEALAAELREQILELES